MSPDELLKKLSEPADLAVFLLGFTFGYVGSLLAHFSEPPAATLAGVSGICALGIKKAADAWLFRKLQVRRLRRRLKSLREHFADNQSALDTLQRLEALLSPPLVEPLEFERILNEQLQPYVETLVKDAGKVTDRYASLYKDFAHLHLLAKAPAASSEPLQLVWNELDTKYFQIKQTRSCRIRRPLRKWNDEEV